MTNISNVNRSKSQSNLNSIYNSGTNRNKDSHLVDKSKKIQSPKQIDLNDNYLNNKENKLLKDD